MELERLGDSPAVAYAACGGIWVMLLHRPPVVDDMRAAEPTLRRMAARCPGGFATLTWILPNAGFSMDAATRGAAADITRDWDKSIRAQATLIEGQGFQGASVRMIIAGLDVLARPSGPTKVFSKLHDAVAWSIAHSPVGVDVAAAVAAIETLRADIVGPRSPA
jgi:hypothetical protein